MNMKRILIVGAIAVAVGAAALLAGVGAPEPAHGEEGGPARTVTVNGTGTVTVRPDEASFSFGIETKAATAEEASDENAEAMRRLIAALKAAGVDEDDLQTEHVSVWPTGEREGGGYTASNSVRLSTSLERAGRLVELATGAGANTVWGPTLERSDSFELQEQALERALENARRKADALADAAGADLGEVIRLVEGGSAGPHPGYETLAMAPRDTAPPIEAGRVRKQATLTVTFELQ
jgi:uncharacterized protein YggE